MVARVSRIICEAELGLAPCIHSGAEHGVLIQTYALSKADAFSDLFREVFFAVELLSNLEKCLKVLLDIGIYNLSAPCGDGAAFHRAVLGRCLQSRHQDAAFQQPTSRKQWNWCTQPCAC